MFNLKAISTKGPFAIIGIAICVLAVLVVVSSNDSVYLAAGLLSSIAILSPVVLVLTYLKEHLSKRGKLYELESELQSRLHKQSVAMESIHRSMKAIEDNCNHYEYKNGYCLNDDNVQYTRKDTAEMWEAWKSLCDEHYRREIHKARISRSLEIVVALRSGYGISLDRSYTDQLVKELERNLPLFGLVQTGTLV